jgi:hypothetical protein
MHPVETVLLSLYLILSQVRDVQCNRVQHNQEDKAQYLHSVLLTYDV